MGHEEIVLKDVLDFAIYQNSFSIHIFLKL